MSIHEDLETARAATCTLCCGPCKCRSGVHMSCCARAQFAGLLTAAEFASLICDGDVYTGTTIIIDPKGAVA